MHTPKDTGNPGLAPAVGRPADFSGSLASCSWMPTLMHHHHTAGDGLAASVVSLHCAFLRL